MARPEYCPALSAPVELDEETGEVQARKLVKCKGASCPLFRKGDQSCALEEIETVRPATTEIRTPPILPGTDSAKLVEDAVAAMSREISGSIRELAAQSAGNARQTEEALRGFRASLREVSGGMEEFLTAVRSFHALRDELKREADRKAGEAEARSRLEKGLGDFRAGRASRAVKELRKCVALGEAAPANARAVLAAALIAAGDPEAGAELLARILDELPDEAEPRANLAHARALLGDFESAATAAREALDRDPRCGAAWNTLGNALYAKGDAAEGVKCWLRAAEVEPGLEAAWMNLVRQRVVSPAQADAALLRGESAAPDPVEPDRAPDDVS